MLTPQEIEQITASLLGIYEDIEDDLLRNIAKRFSATDNISPESMAAWHIKKLDELGELTAENERLIAKYAGKTQREVRQVLENAGYQAAIIDDKVFEKALQAGLLKAAPGAVKSSGAINQILGAAIGNAKNKLNLVNTTALQGAKQDFLDIINQVYLETSLGIHNYSDSVSKAVRALAGKGITSVQYSSKAGRKINTPTDVAVRRMILTSSTQVTGQIQIQRAEEWGSNLVEVTSHIGARPSHAEWQGRIYAINGSEPKYPNLAESTGYGTGEGLKGYNCRHDFYPFFPGISEQVYKPYDEEENRKVYEESQQQRKLERDIRAEKRKLLAANEIKDTDGVDAARARLKAKQDKLDKFLNDTGRTRRTNRTQVVGFEHAPRVGRRRVMA
jgi:hypothetical protein